MNTHIIRGAAALDGHSPDSDAGIHVRAADAIADILVLVDAELGDHAAEQAVNVATIIFKGQQTVAAIRGRPLRGRA